MKHHVLPYALATLMTATSAFAQAPAAPQAPGAANLSAQAPIGLFITAKKPEKEDNEGQGPTREAAKALTQPAPAPVVGSGK